jgi:sulfur carrier protein
MKGMKMKIVVNGKEFEYENEITIKELIKDLKIEGKVMATAVNMEIVKEPNWDNFKLKDGDRVEFLHFVGGG